MKLDKVFPPEWRAPVVFFAVLVVVLYYLYGGIPFEKTAVSDYVPLAVAIGTIAIMAYARRFNEAYKEFMTPGNVIFWGVIVIVIFYLIYFGLT